MHFKIWSQNQLRIVLKQNSLEDRIFQTAGQNFIFTIEVQGAVFIQTSRCEGNPKKVTTPSWASQYEINHQGSSCLPPTSSGDSRKVSL